MYSTHMLSVYKYSSQILPAPTYFYRVPAFCMAVSQVLCFFDIGAAFRVVISNPLTKWDDIESGIQEVRKLGKVVERERWCDNAVVKCMNMYGTTGEIWEGWPFEI